MGGTGGSFTPLPDFSAGPASVVIVGESSETVLPPGGYATAS
jgi:hypothetical protein